MARKRDACEMTMSVHGWPARACRICTLLFRLVPQPRAVIRSVHEGVVGAERVANLKTDAIGIPYATAVWTSVSRPRAMLARRIPARPRRHE